MANVLNEFFSAPNLHQNFLRHSFQHDYFLVKTVVIDWLKLDWLKMNFFISFDQCDRWCCWLTLGLFHLAVQKTQKLPSWTSSFCQTLYSVLEFGQLLVGSVLLNFVFLVVISHQVQQPFLGNSLWFASSWLSTFCNHILWYILQVEPLYHIWHSLVLLWDSNSTIVQKWQPLLQFGIYRRKCHLLQMNMYTQSLS